VRHEELEHHGFHQTVEKYGTLSVYGSDAHAVQDLARAHPELALRLDDALRTLGRGGMVGAARDGTDRRGRPGAPPPRAVPERAAAVRMAPTAARLLAGELGHDERWQKDQVRAFTELAKQYIA